MIKMYKETAQKLLMCASYVKLSGRGLQHVVEHVYGHRQDSPELRFDGAVAYTLATLYPEQRDINTLLKDLRAQLNADENNEGGGDLIDLIVETIQLPYARNGFTRRTLDQLRTALLVPEELAKLKSQLKHREMSCGACGAPLVQGEMVSFASDGPDVVLFCTSCRKPDVISCDERKCDGVVAIDKRLRAALKKPAVCDRHGATVEEKPVTLDEMAPVPTPVYQQPPPAPEAPRWAALRDQLRTTAGEAIRNAPAPAANNYVTWTTDETHTYRELTGRGNPAPLPGAPVGEARDED